MQRTRVALAELAGMLHDIVKEAVTSQPDMAIVADYADLAGPARVLSDNDRQTDVVVIGRELTGTELEVVCGCSEITVLALTDDGRRAYQYKLRPECIQLGAEAAGISPQSLIDAIRSAPKRRAAGLI